jgi:Bax protein
MNVGRGIKPKEQRKSKGNYSVTAYDWPFDSLKAYVRNLNTHRSYEDFRKRRAQLRENGEPITGLVLADTLTRYSERGQAYVDTLKGIIRHNELNIADRVRLRDEPLVLIVNVNNVDDIAPMKKEIKRLRKTGELEEMIREMGLREH